MQVFGNAGASQSDTESIGVDVLQTNDPQQERFGMTRSAFMNTSTTNSVSADLGGGASSGGAHFSSASINADEAVLARTPTDPDAEDGQVTPVRANPSLPTLEQLNSQSTSS